jgi:pimeloyl-ACP methyl ester carboxylesterase
VVARPTVIGVHGGSGIDSTSLIGVLGPLAGVAQTIRFDQRGHGRSDHGQPDNWTVDSWADDLAGLIDVLGSEPPLLLGTSFGSAAGICSTRPQGG